uniref:Uncharacterized protein n=1 Tax=Fagus sylvatica TaxID=28930 RepID=A0A2N9ERX9_FAGSY
MPEAYSTDGKMYLKPYVAVVFAIIPVVVVFSSFKGLPEWFASRLVDIKENSKFKSSGSDNTCIDLHDFIDSIKDKYGLKFVYMWHALAGYWGGVLPSSETMKKYNLVTCYLASCSVDGVNVDVQNLIETLGSGVGGWVSLTRCYQEALKQSIVRNFKDKNLICCMSHNSDSIYSSKKSVVARALEDFTPREPTFQTLHIASVAFNSLLIGEIMVPDWDMFHVDLNQAIAMISYYASSSKSAQVRGKMSTYNIQIGKK